MCLASVIVDLRPAGVEHVPLATELVQVLPVGISGLAVCGVAVQRVPVVGQLVVAVTPCGRSQFACRKTGSGAGRTDRRGGWPEAGARTVTGARVALVGLEQVERPALLVDKRPTGLELRQAQHRAGCLP